MQKARAMLKRNPPTYVKADAAVMASGTTRAGSLASSAMLPPSALAWVQLVAHSESVYERSLYLRAFLTEQHHRSSS